MDEDLDSLIEKITREGVSQAEKESKEIERQAREKADAIIANARSKADDKIQKTEEECKRQKQAMLDELELASRDLILSVEQKVLQMFRNTLEEKISISLSSGQSTFIKSIFEKWKGSEQGWSIHLSEPELRNLTDDLLNSMREKVKGGLEIQSDSEIKSGFKIMVKDGSYYLDFTVGTMAELLMEQLSPILRNILRKTSRKDDNEP